MHVTWTAIKEAIPRAKNLLSGKECNANLDKGETMSTTVKTDLYEALMPIYHLSKIFGLLPVKFVAHSTGRYIGKLRVINICYSMGLLFFLVGALIWGLWRDSRDGWELSIRLKSPTAMAVSFGDAAAVVVLASVSVLGAPSRWKFFQEIIARLVEADGKLGFVAPKKTRRFSVIVTSAILVFLTALSAVDIYSWEIRTKTNRKMPDKGPMNYSPIYVMYMIALIVEIQYALSTYNLGERFSRLNKNLEALLKSSKYDDYTRKDYAQVGDSREQVNIAAVMKPEVEYRKSVRVYRTPKISDWLVNEEETRNISDALSQLITVHSSLCDVSLLINRAFGLPILVVTITSLLHLIITPYVLLGRTNEIQWFFIVIQLLWCVFHVAKMLMVVQPCYSTSTEAKGTAIKIGQLLSISSEPDVRKQLEIFSLQLLHRPVNFSACGLFSIDRALVTSMAGAVTTYLVILIQFQKADDTIDAKNILNETQQLLKGATRGNSTAQKLIP